MALGVLLVTHGNRWLSGPKDAAPQFPSRDSPSLKFIGRLTFGYERRWLGTVKTHEPEEWLTGLRNRGATRLALVTSAIQTKAGGAKEDERYLAGFVGGGNQWFVLASGPRHAEAWESKWDVAFENAPDNRIWSVEWKGRPTSMGLATGPTVAQTTAKLAAALAEAHDFARGQGIHFWADWFAEALALGTSDAPLPPFYPDMVPMGFPPEYTRLLAMASKADVFGGMGSWNDRWQTLLESDVAGAEYERVSSRLYEAMQEGMAVAASGHARQSEAP